jgi:thioredoxin-dependent peroxiredoxin
MRMLVLLVALAACSKDSAPAAPAAPPERTDLIRRGDKPLTLVGKTLDVGDPMPDVTVAGEKLAPLKLAALRGKLVVLSIVPSIDTPVCEAQTHKVSDAMVNMPSDAVVITISRDLPFAQQRFKTEALTKTEFGSDYKTGELGRAFGLEVKETGLLARSTWVIGKDGKITYRELVADQGTEPDVDALVAAVTKANGG